MTAAGAACAIDEACRRAAEAEAGRVGLREEEGASDVLGEAEREVAEGVEGRWRGRWEGGRAGSGVG